MGKLSQYLTMLKAKMTYAEELYGIKINSLPLIVESEEIIILDRRDGKIKRLPGKRELNEDEIQKLENKILKNIEGGKVDMYLTMNMMCVRTPGE